MKQKSSAIKMSVISCVYMFFTVAMLAVFVIPYGLLPEYFGVNFTLLGLGVTGCSIVSIIGLYIAPKVLQKIKTKGCMMLGALLIFLYGLDMAFVRNFIGLFISFALLGGVCAFSMYVMNTDFIMKWFAEKQATVISIGIGTGLVGTGVLQFLAGQLLGTLGVKNLFLLFSTVVAVIDFGCALLVKNTPEDIGEQPYGAKDNVKTEENVVKEQEKEPQKIAQNTNVYKSPVFWFFICAMVFGGGIQISMVTSYMTSYFPLLGMDIALASTLVSLMGLLAGGANMIGGRVMEKIGMKPYVTILMIMASVSNFLMYLYGGIQNVIILVAIVVSYAIAYVGFSVCNVLVGPLFGSQATEVNSKLLMVTYGISLVSGTLFGAIVDHFGFRTLYMITSTFGIIAMVFYLCAFAAAKKQNV